MFKIKYWMAGFPELMLTAVIFLIYAIGGFCFFTVALTIWAVLEWNQNQAL